MQVKQQEPSCQREVQRLICTHVSLRGNIRRKWCSAEDECCLGRCTMAKTSLLQGCPLHLGAWASEVDLFYFTCPEDLLYFLRYSHMFYSQWCLKTRCLACNHLRHMSRSFYFSIWKAMVWLIFPFFLPKSYTAQASHAGCPSNWIFKAEAGVVVFFMLFQIQNLNQAIWRQYSPFTLQQQVADKATRC